MRVTPQAENELLVWYQAARRAAWTNLADVRNSFPTADLVGKVLVFNICHERKEWMKWARQH